MLLLIVENDPDLRSTLDEALSECHSVMSVATAVEALAAEPERFDVIVTDYRMPAMSGLELHRVLRERGVPVPMVLMSADPDTNCRTTLSGFCGYLAKPFEFAELEDVLDRIARAGVDRPARSANLRWPSQIRQHRRRA